MITEPGDGGSEPRGSTPAAAEERARLGTSVFRGFGFLPGDTLMTLKSRLKLGTRRLQQHFRTGDVSALYFSVEGS